jgi:hypothetical protein
MIWGLAASILGMFFGSMFSKDSKIEIGEVVIEK